MATGYDDAFNQTPERLLRNVLSLGYRGDINHYVGMSHYFRLEALGSGLYVSLTGGTLNAPCAAWHREFAARAKALGLGVIFSLSSELLNEHRLEGRRGGKECVSRWSFRGTGDY